MVAYARDAVARGLRPGRSFGEPLVRAALAGDVFLGAGQLAATDVAQQLFQHGQRAAARRTIAHRQDGVRSARRTAWGRGRSAQVVVIGQPPYGYYMHDIKYRHRTVGWPGRAPCASTLRASDRRSGLRSHRRPSRTAEHDGRGPTTGTTRRRSREPRAMPWWCAAGSAPLVSARRTRRTAGAAGQAQRATRPAPASGWCSSVAA